MESVNKLNQSSIFSKLIHFLIKKNLLQTQNKVIDDDQKTIESHYSEM